MTQQRLYDSHQLPEDLAVISARIEGDDLAVAFSDGHAVQFSVAALLSALDPSHGLPPPIARRGDRPPSANFDWQSVSRPGQMREVLTAFLTYGFVILRNTPTERRSVLTIAETFSHVRDTNFGRIFEVYSQPDGNDLAYRPVALAPQLGLDGDGHLQYADHEWYESCVRFCRDWDQESFDPDYPTRPLSHFEPLIREIFSRPPFDPEVLAGKASG